MSLPGKTQPDLNSSTSSSLEAGLGLPPCFHSNGEQRASCSSVGIPQTPVPASPRVRALRILGMGQPLAGVHSRACLCTALHIQSCQCMLLHKHMNTIAYADTCTVTQAWAHPSRNGTGDHPAGCDPLPQPPSPPWCGKGLGKEKILFTTPTATQLADHVLGMACGISCSSHSTTG